MFALSRVGRSNMGRSVVRSFAGVNLTKIVATIGPVSEDAKTLPAVVEGGMTVMRLNFSHATDEEVTLRMKSLIGSAGMFPLDAPGRTDLRPILLDTKGPEIRTGNLQAVHDTGDVKAKISLKTGDEITLTNDSSWNGKSDAKTMYITYSTLATTAKVGQRVLLDDGAISLLVKAHSADGSVVCVVENDGEIASRRGVNLPGMKVDLPPMSDKDRADIRYGIEKDMDFVAASFVRKAADIHEIRAHIDACHAEFWPADYPKARIIAKVWMRKKVYVGSCKRKKNETTSIPYLQRKPKCTSAFPLIT